MDFAFTEEQTAIRDLAADIFTGTSGPERIKAVEASAERIDRDLWRELARAGLVGIALPAESGGGGMGFTELCVLLEQQGRSVAPVPLWETALAAAAVAEFGTPDQQREYVAPAAAGELFLTVGLEEFGPADPVAPETSAHRSGTGTWVLTGAKAVVPAAHIAGRVVVSAATPTGTGLFLADPAGAGVHAENNETTTRALAATLAFDNAPVELLAEGDSVQWLVSRAEIALAAVQTGVGAGAVQHAVNYLNERRQFGRPLSTFQAVGHQLADCYIDLEAMRVTLWQAAWLLGNDEDPGTAVPVAKWWATDGGQRVVHRAQHVHGGIGVDIDYPVHRYLLWGKQIAATLGSASADLARLGDLLARPEVAV
ncbi:acyl-CoA/acyl-ACP dehydrogenase [Nocardia flavorosea]|uniref:acyl-CoA dehydrogenase family protein n=1 Tax=Nocardia flavorosea TaxID=53429 RepID=UPI00189616B3|nr:acyl-CoA dehydrogenase family protein [Nocardia flavorosea]MBF6347887.1 acyl-CoA/acyl-ACP dehydrogenase [Nocardia flavorosea]